MGRSVPPLRKLRQAFVDVEWLAKFLRRYPAAFLNAPVVPEAPIHPVALAIGEKSVTPIRKEKNLSKHENKFQSCRPNAAFRSISCRPAILPGWMLSELS